MSAVGEDIPEEAKDRMMACIDLVGRTGAQDFQLRFSDDEKPVVWIAVAGFKRSGAARSGNPAKRAERLGYQVGAGITPDIAAFRLLEQLVDGGRCTHCQRPTGVDDDWAGEQPLDELVCWYVYDPELKKFRRGCEGS